MISAPTSSGKTFISFYAMEQVGFLILKICNSVSPTSTPPTNTTPSYSLLRRSSVSPHMEAICLLLCMFPPQKRWLIKSKQRLLLDLLKITNILAKLFVVCCFILFYFVCLFSFPPSLPSPNPNFPGVFTKDFRYNVESCQILVTVPDCLDVMLLSPQYASWMKRIRWVIFDEVSERGGRNKEGGRGERKTLIECNLGPYDLKRGRRGVGEVDFVP